MMYTKNMFRRIALIILLISTSYLLLACDKVDKQTISEFDVNFTVVNGPGQAVSGANVTLDGTTVSTNQSGLASFPISNGTYNYTVSAAGYKELSDSIVVNGDNIQVNITLPVILFEEDFTGAALSQMPTGWSTTHTNYWSVEGSSNAGGDSPEILFDCLNSSDFISRITSPEINASGFNELILEFSYNADLYTPVAGGFAFKVATKLSSGSDWVEQWSFTPVENITQSEKIVLTLPGSLSGEKFHISWEFNGTGWRLYRWYIDDIIITAK